VHRLLVTAFAAALVAVAAPALADSMASSSMMMMPSCAAGDSVVGVNMTTKMYMTTAQMKAKSMGMSAAQKQAMMQKNHVKMMCKSKAMSMGAKPMKPSM
jgi:hypothetical protein